MSYFLWTLILIQALLIYILLRNRSKYKSTRRLLKQTQHDLEHRVVERTDKLRAINNKLYDEIAKHEKTEELLRESQEYINSIINSMSSILIGVTPQSAVTHWNSAAEQATGIGAQEALGRILKDIYPDLPVESSAIKEAIINHQAKVCENQLTNDGSYIDVSIFPLASKKLSGAVLRIDDVTMRVQLENMMTQTEKMMSLGELAAGTAHEINNPLSAILQGVQNINRRLGTTMKKNRQTAESLDTNMETIRSYLQEREILHFLENIKEAGERASHIVQNMLEFSRANNSNHSPINIIELIENTLELATDSFKLDIGVQFTRIKIDKQFADKMPSLNCSGAEIQQVLLNLLRNASQALNSKKLATETEPTITVKANFDDNYATLEVADNGPGMKDAVKRHIFEPFFTTKDVGQGTGLGLSVSYFIITEHHGGTIEVDSKLGLGSRFIIRLPLY